MPSKKKLKVPITLQKRIRKRSTPENSDGWYFKLYLPLILVERDRERGSRIRRRVDSTEGK